MSAVATDDVFQIQSEHRVLDFGRSITHRIRLRILIGLHADAPQSATMLHRSGIAPLSTVRHHLDQMELMGVVKVVKTTQRESGGGPELRHFALTDFGLTVLRVASLVSRQ